MSKGYTATHMRKLLREHKAPLNKRIAELESREKKWEASVESLERQLEEDMQSIEKLEADLNDSKFWQNHWKNESSSAKAQLAEYEAAWQEGIRYEQFKALQEKDDE